MKSTWPRKEVFKSSCASIRMERLFKLGLLIFLPLSLVLKLFLSGWVGSVLDYCLPHTATLRMGHYKIKRYQRVCLVCIGELIRTEVFHAEEMKMTVSGRTECHRNSKNTGQTSSIITMKWESTECQGHLPLTPQLLVHNILQAIQMLYHDQFNSIWSSTIYQANCRLSRNSIHFSWSHSEYPGWFKLKHSACWCIASQLKTLF